MDDRLTILWTNADPITAEMMVFMYAEGSLEYSFWKEVEIIIWGSTAKLVAEDKHIQKRLLEIKDKGVKFRGCISCARELNVVQELTELGITLEPMGQPLTQIIKENKKLITV